MYIYISSKVTEMRDTVIYNGKKCAYQKNENTAKLIPLSVYDNIGNGSGATITVSQSELNKLLKLN